MAGFNRILKNFGAMFTGRLLSVIQQVIVPPIFAARYSLGHFGEWGVLSGAVAAIGMLNFGVQTYMNQDLAIRYNRGDITDYKVRQSTALRLLLGAILTAAALGLVIFLLPRHAVDHVSARLPDPLRHPVRLSLRHLHGRRARPSRRALEQLPDAAHLARPARRRPAASAIPRARRR